MENTLENKRKFFAQYYGQNVYVVNQDGYSCDVKDIPFENINWNLNWCMLLTPLSSITDEDAIEVADIFDLSDEDRAATYFPECVEVLLEEPVGYYIDDYTGNQLLECIDYLRSKGYALPWMGLSVEKLMEYGWVVLKRIE